MSSLESRILKKLTDFEKIRVYSGFLTEIEISTYKYFLDGLTTKDLGIFQKSKKWNFLYYFIRELTHQLMKSGKHSCFVLNFDLNSQNLNIDIPHLSILMELLHEDIFSILEVSDSGFPEWFKKCKWKGKGSLESEVLHFSVKLRSRILSRLDSGKQQFIKNQKDAIDMVRGSLKKEKIHNILKLIDYRAPGEKSKRQMEYEFNIVRANRLFQECKKLLVGKVCNVREIETEWKKLRITKRKCLKYLLYWGLLGTISFRKNRGIEVSTEKEHAFFGFSYKLLREAMVSLGYIKCIDSTYCISLRCRTFKINIFMPKELKISEKNTIELNNLEKQYADLPDDQKRCNMEYHTAIVHYLDKRIEASNIYSNFKMMNKEVSKKYFLLNKYKENMMKDVVREKFKEVKNIQMNRDLIIRNVESFIMEFSNARSFDWQFKSHIKEVA